MPESITQTQQLNINRVPAGADAPNGLVGITVTGELVRVIGVVAEVRNATTAIASAQLRKNEWAANRPPSAADDASAGFSAGSRWLFSGQEWVAADVTAGNAVWNLQIGEDRFMQLFSDVPAGSDAQSGIIGVTSAGEIVRVIGLVEDVRSATSAIASAQLRKNEWAANRPPSAADDETQGYAVGSRWLWGDDWLRRALPGGGDAGWMPAAVLTPMHFGAVGDGVADDTAAIQAAMDWAARYEQDVTVPLARHIRKGQKYKIDLNGLVYGVSSALYLKGGVEFSGGSLKAISAFPTGGGADSFVLNIGEGRPTVNISVDGGLNPDNSRNANCVRVDGARQGEISVYAIHFPEYGVRVVNAQECRMYFDAKEWLWEEAGRTDSTLRTAIGISIEAHDCAYIEPQASSCMVPLYISGSLNQINGGHFYNGGVADASVDHINVLIETVGAVAADNNIFTSVYSDNGIIKMVDAFANSFIGCLHQKNADGKQTTRFEVVTTKANTRLNGLVVVGNRFNGSAPEPLRKTTSGVGSFIADTREVWSGNVRSDGAPVAGGTKLEGFKIASGTKTQVYGTGVIDIFGDDHRQKLHVGPVADGYAVAFPNGSGNAMDWDRALTFNPTGGVRQWFQGPPASGNYVVTKNDLTTLGVGESGVEKLGVASVVATNPAAFTANRHIALKDTSGNTYYVPCRSVPW